MWSSLTKINGVTETIVAPKDGIVSVEVPMSVELCAYVNGSEVPVHHVHVKAGDSIYFKLKRHAGNIPSVVNITYDGEVKQLHVSTESPVEYKTYEESKMTPAETINLFSNPGMGGMGAGAGAGLGAGLLGGVLGGALLNRRGLLNDGDGVGGFVTPTQLQTGLDSVTQQQQNTAIMQTLGDIKASVPLAESQVQLALAGAQNDINAQINSSTSNLLGNQALIARDISGSTATILASQNSVEDTVQNGIASVNLAISNSVASALQNTYALNTAIRDDGDKTRALIIAQNDAMLNRQLATAEAALLEQRAIGRSREVEVNVTQTVTQNQAQLQAQAQQQQQFMITNNLLQALLNQAQIAQATNQSLVIGNTGYASSGPQTANPTNVRA